MSEPIEYKKCEDGSYLYNCALVRRDSDPVDLLFHQDGDKSMTARLNGYAIIPLEEYVRLTGPAGFPAAKEMLERVPEADRQLHGEEQKP